MRRAIIVLPAPGASDEQQIVSTGAGDLERPPGRQLSADVGQIGVAGAGRWRRRQGRGRGARRIVQRLHRFGQRRHREHLQTFHDRRFGSVHHGEQDARCARTSGGHGNRQHAARLVDRSVERQLAKENELGSVPPFDGSLRGENAERDRQIEGRAGLAHVGWRQIHRDAMRRELEAGISDRASHALPALADARVRQTDHRE
jgi:hypothetical protein